MFITNFWSHHREHTELAFKFGTLLQMPDYSVKGCRNKSKSGKKMYYLPNDPKRRELLWINYVTLGGK